MFNVDLNTRRTRGDSSSDNGATTAPFFQARDEATQLRAASKVSLAAGGYFHGALEAMRKRAETAEAAVESTESARDSTRKRVEIAEAALWITAPQTIDSTGNGYFHGALESMRTRAENAEAALEMTTSELSVATAALHGAHSTFDDHAESLVGEHADTVSRLQHTHSSRLALQAEKHDEAIALVHSGYDSVIRNAEMNVREEASFGAREEIASAVERLRVESDRAAAAKDVAIAELAVRHAERLALVRSELEDEIATSSARLHALSERHDEALHEHAEVTAMSTASLHALTERHGEAVASLEDALTAMRNENASVLEESRREHAAVIAEHTRGAEVLVKDHAAVLERTRRAHAAAVTEAVATAAEKLATEHNEVLERTRREHAEALASALGSEALLPSLADAELSLEDSGHFVHADASSAVCSAPPSVGVLGGGRKEEDATENSAAVTAAAAAAAPTHALSFELATLKTELAQTTIRAATAEQEIAKLQEAAAAAAVAADVRGVTYCHRIQIGSNQLRSNGLPQLQSLPRPCSTRKQVMRARTLSLSSTSEFVALDSARRDESARLNVKKTVARVARGDTASDKATKALETNGIIRMLQATNDQLQEQCARRGDEIDALKLQELVLRERISNADGGENVRLRSSSCKCGPVRTTPTSPNVVSRKSSRRASRGGSSPNASPMHGTRTVRSSSGARSEVLQALGSSTGLSGSTARRHTNFGMSRMNSRGRTPPVAPSIGKTGNEDRIDTGDGNKAEWSLVRRQLLASNTASSSPEFHTAPVFTIDVNGEALAGIDLDSAGGSEFGAIARLHLEIDRFCSSRS